MDEEYFWIVWKEGESPPRKRHTSKESAEAEAQRLAIKENGQTFFILEAVSCVAANNVCWNRELSPPF
jgi:hypothetical protein